MRDPCVVRGPDGRFHLVWTSGWNENNVGYASSTGFIAWSEQQEIPVMPHEPTVRNSWAPEAVHDASQRCDGNSNSGAIRASVAMMSFSLPPDFAAP